METLGAFDRQRKWIRTSSDGRDLSRLQWRVDSPRCVDFPSIGGCFVETIVIFIAIFIKRTASRSSSNGRYHDRRDDRDLHQEDGIATRRDGRISIGRTKKGQPIGRSGPPSLSDLHRTMDRASRRTTIDARSWPDWRAIMAHSAPNWSSFIAESTTFLFQLHRTVFD